MSFELGRPWDRSKISHQVYNIRYMLYSTPHPFQKKLALKIKSTPDLGFHISNPGFIFLFKKFYGIHMFLLMNFDFYCQMQSEELQKHLIIQSTRWRNFHICTSNLQILTFQNYAKLFLYLLNFNKWSVTRVSRLIVCTKGFKQSLAIIS